MENVDNYYFLKHQFEGIKKLPKAMRICWPKIWKKREAKESEPGVWENFILKIVIDSKNKGSIEKLKELSAISQL